MITQSVPDFPPDLDGAEVGPVIKADDCHFDTFFAADSIAACGTSSAPSMFPVGARNARAYWPAATDFWSTGNPPTI